MDTLLTGILPITLFVALGATLIGWLGAAFGGSARLERGLRGGGMAIAAVYLLWLIGLGVWQGRSPVLTAGQFFAYAGGMVWIWTQYLQFRVRLRLLNLLPLIATVGLLGLSLLFGHRPPSSPDQTFITSSAAMHVTFTLAAAVNLLGCALFSAMEFAMVRGQGTRQHPECEDAARRMPTLEETGALRRKTLTVGWIMITHGAVLGLFNLLINPGSQTNAMHLHPMLLLWGLLTVIVLSRRLNLRPDRLRLTPQRRAMASLAVSGIYVMLLVISLIGVYHRAGA